MKKQILSEEFRRMQKLAGLITENLNPEEIKQNFRDGIDGFYVFKGGNSFGKGSQKKIRPFGPRPGVHLLGGGGKRRLG